MDKFGMKLMVPVRHIDIDEPGTCSDADIVREHGVIGCQDQDAFSWVADVEYREVQERGDAICHDNVLRSNAFYWAKVVVDETRHSDKKFWF